MSIFTTTIDWQTLVVQRIQFISFTFDFRDLRIIDFLMLHT